MSETKNLVKREENTPEKARVHTVTPAVDIYENQDEYLFLVDLPGVTEENVTVRWDRDRLSIEGKRTLKTSGEPVAAEYPEWDYSRTFRVPDEIDGDNILAKMNQGVLTVHLPKAEAVKPREIQIQAE